MLSEKPWRADAVLRLAVSVLMCIFIGTLAMSSIRYHGTLQKNPMLFFSATAAAFGFFAGALWLLSRPLNADKFRRQFFTLLLCILLLCVCAGMCLMWISLWLSGSTHSSANGISLVEIGIAALSFHGAALALIFRFLREHGTTWSEGFGFKNGLKEAVQTGALIFFLALPGGWGLQAGSVWLMKQFHVQPQEQQAVQMLRSAEHWPNRVALAVFAILLAPVVEEMLFRGILYPAIKQQGFPRSALWGTSLFFAAIHTNLATFVPLTFLSLVLIWLYEKTDNLLAPVVTHSLFNTANFVALYFLQDKPGQ